MKMFENNNKIEATVYLVMVLIFFATETIVNARSFMSEELGAFWQITDIHWDLNYAQDGNASAMCHKRSDLHSFSHDGNNRDGSGSVSVQSNIQDNGKYGNYLCDSPWKLVKSTLDAMAELHATPDFILWTGDMAPHVRDPPPPFTDIFHELNTVTAELQHRFPTTAILPVLGNHDAFPPNDFPNCPQKFYLQYLTEGGWERLLDREQQKTFLLGGYYSHPTPIFGVTVVVVNTNLYYMGNDITTPDPDPCGQLAWLEEQMQHARDTRGKVLLSAHSPPGFFERMPAVPFLKPPYNSAFLELTRRYSDVLHSHVYGHLHTDTFRLMRGDNGVDSVAFLAPSVTPWRADLVFGGTAINPSLRLYVYDFHSVLDYTQFHLNLTEANSDPNTGANTEPTAVHNINHNTGSNTGTGADPNTNTTIDYTTEKSVEPNVNHTTTGHNSDTTTDRNIIDNLNAVQTDINHFSSETIPNVKNNDSNNGVNEVQDIAQPAAAQLNVNVNFEVNTAAADELNTGIAAKTNSDPPKNSAAAAAATLVGGDEGFHRKYGTGDEKATVESPVQGIRVAIRNSRSTTDLEDDINENVDAEMSDLICNETLAGKRDTLKISACEAQKKKIKVLNTYEDSNRKTRETFIGSAGSANWKIYYRAREAYSLDRLDAANMNVLYNRLEENRDLFNMYIERNSAGYDKTYCTKFCRKCQLCAIRYQETAEVFKCVGYTRTQFEKLLNSTFKHHNVDDYAQYLIPDNPIDTTLDKIKIKDSTTSSVVTLNKDEPVGNEYTHTVSRVETTTETKTKTIKSHSKSSTGNIANPYVDAPGTSTIADGSVAWVAMASSVAVLVVVAAVFILVGRRVQRRWFTKGPDWPHSLHGYARLNAG